MQTVCVMYVECSGSVVGRWSSKRQAVCWACDWCSTIAERWGL